MTDSNNPRERFFDAHAPQYMSNVFTMNTLAEAAKAAKQAELRAAVHTDSELAELAIPDIMKNYVRRWFLTQG